MKTRLVSLVAGAALILSLTTGCQANSPDISSEKAEEFQTRVLGITTAVADGSYAKALDALTVLETELDAALADGSISKERQQRIEAALAAVRADVQAAIDALAEPEPAPSPVETVTPDDDDADEDTETDAEKKAREAAEKAAEKKAEETEKKAEDARKKAEEEAKKKAEEDARNNTETPPATEEPGSDG